MQDATFTNLDNDTTDEWLGFKRHRFTLAEHEAWIVEPFDPTPERLWFAVPEWPYAFPERNGVKSLLEHGYYMVHVNIFGLFANSEAVAIMHDMYKLLRKNGFAAKGAFIGMSWGGMYTFRYAETHPECVACIYADAPVCDLAFELEHGTNDFSDVPYAYGRQSLQDMVNHRLSPVNNHERIAEYRLPVFMLLGMSDETVNPATNGLLLAKRLAAKGHEIQLVKRNAWGHHPHGLDNPAQIVNFILRHTLNVKFTE